ncbi:hypothetical protein SBA6_570010 [Candidatus Sulfopaludibacter sp. SbA6]|nr:hypothetical protein SBA6_570010 [Candidatus Sulfopaludibacter sp. SbA6]
MNDYTWPSVYFAYFFFAICLVLALFFFFRSRKDGYWSKESEDIRYHVFEDGVAQALVPAASALMPTSGVDTLSQRRKSVEKSLDTAGMSACATNTRQDLTHATR